MVARHARLKVGSRANGNAQVGLALLVSRVDEYDRAAMQVKRGELEVVCVCLGLAALTATSGVSADAPATGALRATQTTPIEVAREHVALECRVSGATRDDLECQLHVTWELRNPTSAPLAAPIVISWPHDAAAELSIAASPTTELPRLRPASVIVGPNESTVVELRATLPMDDNLRGRPDRLDSLDPIHARHPVLSERWQRVRREIVWVRPDDLRFGAVGPSSISVRLPEGWQGGGDLRPEGDLVFAYSSSDQDPKAAITLRLSRGSEGDFLRHGGPFLALGGTIDAGFRGRLGYEIGLGEFVLVSLGVDSDFEHQVIITPQVEIASWSMVLIPSISLGLGVPIRVTNNALYPSTAGIRIESSATFFSAAFVATLDIWPGDPMTPYQVSLLGRVGL